MAKMADEIKELRRKVRELEDEIMRLGLEYSYLSDLVSDAAYLLKKGKPLDRTLKDEIMRFEAQESGQEMRA
jgi:hypothetical protein